MLRKDIERDHPYISVLTYGGKEYVGIIVNQDHFITTILNYSSCRNIEDKKYLLELGKIWWMEPLFPGYLLARFRLEEKHRAVLLLQQLIWQM